MFYEFNVSSKEIIYLFLVLLSTIDIFTIVES
jgi:hypothetical protein